MSTFRGFSPEAIEFLRELEDNNDRDWFKANRARYEDHLRAPAVALGADLAELGQPRLFRPWNDTRFRPGPSPAATSSAPGCIARKLVRASAPSSTPPRRSCAGCASGWVRRSMPLPPRARDDGARRQPPAQRLNSS